jgi:hypothetical protein
MTERVFIGNDGGQFKMRISKPGITARNATIDQCTIHEAQVRPLVYLQQGYVNVSPGSSVTVSLGRTFTVPPVVILKHESHQILAATARLTLGTGALQIIAASTATGSLVKYVVMAPT